MAEADLSTWVGRRTVAHDSVDAARVANLAATLDRPVPAPGSALPEAWHWILFNQLVPRPEVGPDGHPKRGGFLPPVALPRRMWAGSRLEFVADLAVGAAARRESEILDVKEKQGRHGALVFVTVRHRIFGDDRLAIVEEHDIVYREIPKPGEAAATEQAPVAASWRDTVTPDPVLLFRYSALTLNGHRIHYDHPYVTQVEGYPGLIVHGPLIATLLLDLARRSAPARSIDGFTFRARSPLFADAPFTVNGMPSGDTAALWATAPSGALAMEATVTFEAA
jgi:3-methylfumaryl-CoA hydratase